MIDIYIMIDQPTTCPQCGSRAEILSEFKMDGFGTIFCRCNSNECLGYLFLEQGDDYFSMDYWMDENRE